MNKRDSKKTGTKKSQGFKNRKGYKMRYHDDKINLQKTACLDRVCARCFEQLQWKLTYGKYKQIKQPKKCVNCKNKCIMKSYRQLCNKCGDSLKKCTKCGNKGAYHLPSYEYAPKVVKEKRAQLAVNMMKMMTERSKRTLLRQINDEKIRFLNGKFLYKCNNKEVKGIVYKKKYREEFDDDEEFGDDSEDMEETGVVEEKVEDAEGKGEEKLGPITNVVMPVGEPPVTTGGGGNGIKITF